MFEFRSVHIGFALLFFVLYWITAKINILNNGLLFIFGLAFYAWGNLFYALALFGLICFNFILLQIFFQKEQCSKLILVAALAGNIAVWIVLKFSLLPITENNQPATGLLPVGMSFYMLRIISVLVQVYKGRMKEIPGFIAFGLYIAYMPQLLSGPIEMPDSFLQQVQSERSLDKKCVQKALSLFVLGLIKKMVIADNLGLVIDTIFRLEQPSILLVMLGSAGFYAALFADFSAYTDISRGISFLLGFETSKNFNQPILAASPQDFWNRWHITFSNWLRDHIFYPLRRWCLRKFGKEHPLWAIILPPLATMAVSGLWHGNGWTYIVWGVYHGCLMVAFQILPKKKAVIARERSGGKHIFTWAITNGLVVMGWAIFRAPSLEWLWSVLMSGNIGLRGYDGVVLLSIAGTIFGYILPLLIKMVVDHCERFKTILEPIYYALALLLLIIFSNSGVRGFLYTGF